MCILVRYELTNHLGNVLATISDRKVWNNTDSNYEPVITMKADYYAFGMLMPNRFEGVDDARHLFNGMEHDMEVSGEGNASNLTIKSVGLKMGFSALAQGVINEGKINVIGVLGDGILGYGSSSIIGSGLEYNFNVLTLNNEFNYLGNGIDGQQFLFNSTIGITFGKKSDLFKNQLGKTGINNALIEGLTLPSSQFSQYGISRYYEKKGR